MEVHCALDGFYVPDGLLGARACVSLERDAYSHGARAYSGCPAPQADHPPDVFQLNQGDRGGSRSVLNNQGGRAKGNL